MKNNTIQVNGNLYDAVTGKRLGSTVTPRIKTTGRNIDGFFRSRTTKPVASDTHKITVATKTQPAAPKPARTAAAHAKLRRPQPSQRVVRADVTAPAKLSHQPKHSEPKHAASAAHHKPHKPQSAITLMRTAVKRPSPSIRKQANAQGALAHTNPSIIPVKHTASYVDEDRLVRATTTPTSSMVAHHGKEVSRVAPAVVPLHVVPVPVKPEGDVPAAVPAPQPTNKPQDIFDHALASANHFVDVKQHRAHFRKQSRHHVASMAAGMLALLVIAGFAIFQNSPGLQLKVAGMRAGVATTMPNFQAAGFAYTGVKAGDGKLTLGFSGGGSHYQLIQQDTNSSSQDMIRDISSTDAGGHPNYTTLKTDGTTVYRFSNTSATWISGGKWYSVTGNGALSNDQIKSLVENV
jgi:hypothetical protein